MSFEEKLSYLPIIAAGLLILFLLTQRWFWMLSFFVGGLASCFSMIASVIHFQILAAVGFFFLMWLLWTIAVVVASD